MNHRLYWENEANIAQIVTSLEAEKVSICTTDTVLGFLAVATQKTFDRINTIKGRYEKPYLVLIPSKEVIAEFVDLPCKKLEELVNAVWPGPVTLIFKAKSTVEPFLQSQQGTIALRVPNHKGLQSVMKYTWPLFSTSANLAGAPIPETIEKVVPEILKQIDIIITDKKLSEKVIPSTIVDCTNPEDIKIIRQGAFDISRFIKK